MKKDLKYGILTLKPEVSGDLIIIKSLLMPGDKISGYTVRSISIQQGNRKIRGEKKKIYVAIQVQKVSFSETGDQLRVGGIILEGSDEVEHAYHTMEVVINEPVKIEKKWHKFELDKIEKAKIKPVNILACILDETECDIFSIKDKITKKAEFQGSTGKRYQTDSSKYYREIIDYIKDKSFDYLIIAGPGFAKDSLKQSLSDDIKQKTIFDSVSHTGMSGIRELIRRGTIEKVSKHFSIAGESVIVEKFFTLLATDGPVVYGIRETKQALDAGSVKDFLIIETMLREHESLVEKAEQQKSNIYIIEANHEAGERFKSFGVAGILRYKL